MDPWYARIGLGFVVVVVVAGMMSPMRAPAHAAATGTIDVRVTASADDAEENPRGNVNTVSTDLDMVFDRLGSGLNNRAIGLRFAGIPIPSGARITEAYVVFQVDETSSEPTDLTVHGEASDDAGPFIACTGCADLSARPTTTAAVSWSPGPWSTVGETQPTSDLTSIIQEIVDRPGWASGNALAILIGGTGERTAESFDGTAIGAPLLHVVWDNPGHVTLRKLTNGAEDDAMSWNFTLAGPGVDAADSSPPATLDFGGVNLRPGEPYTLCETGIPAGWTLVWRADADGDGTPDAVIPIAAGVADDPVDPDVGYSRVYDPNFVPSPGVYSNDTRCVNLVVDPDETLALEIDNRFPGGEPRTIGFWKNWNTCTGGNQSQTAADNGGPGQGWFILDDLLAEPGLSIGTLVLADGDCELAVHVLDKRDADGRKRANDAAYNLASQLLAAQLNLSLGAETCDSAVEAVNAAQLLLEGVGFDANGQYLRPRNGQAYRDALALAEVLDAYNRGALCG